MTDQELVTLSAELQRRDPRFLHILDMDDGTGTYEIRSLTTGRPMTATFTYCTEHTRVLTPRFDAETRKRLAGRSYAPPDPYDKDLKALREKAARR